MIEFLCRKLADLELYLNNIPVAQRKSFVIRVSLILFVLLILFSFGHKIRLSAKKDAIKSEQPTIDDLSRQVEEELNAGISDIREQTKHAFRLIDSMKVVDSLRNIKSNQNEK